MDLDLAQYIDHAFLNPAATTADIDKLCAEAIEYKFFGVCVNPIYVRHAVRALSATKVAVVTVVGFPFGTHLTDIKIAEAQRALAEGAEELDMVINIGALKEGNIQYVTSEIESIVKIAKDSPVKVIIETDLLSKKEKITATEICIKTGVYMVKTSTGFVKDGIGATVEDVALLKDTIGGASLKIKASAGIKDYKKAKVLIDAGASRLGTSSSVAILKESLAAMTAVNS